MSQSYNESEFRRDFISLVWERAQSTSLRGAFSILTSFVTDVVLGRKNPVLSHLFVIQAVPGGGKSSGINSFLKAYSGSLCAVIAFNPTNVHALCSDLASFRDSGKVDVCSVESLRSAKLVNNYDLVVLDEAQDVTYELAETVIKSVKLGGSLLLIGDDHQSLRAGASGILITANTIVNTGLRTRWVVYKVLTLSLRDLTEYASLHVL